MDGRIKAQSRNFKKVHAEKKQYFEQRRRQQQQTTGSKSYADDININMQHHKENRSLDIRNLLHLSNLAHECKSKIPNETNASKIKCDNEKSPPTIYANTIMAPDSAKVKGKRISSARVKNASVKKDLFNVLNNHDDKINKIDDKVEPWRMIMGSELSVLDLLGDDGPSGTAEASPVHEAHVAFSVEGLAKVGTTTPFHSPQQDRRATRQLNASRDPAYFLDSFKFDEDAHIPNMDLHPKDDSLEFSGDVKDFSYPRESLPEVQDHIDFGGGYNILEKSSLDMKKLFRDIEDKNENLWNAMSSFSDEDLSCEESWEASWKNWHCKLGGASVKFSNSDDQLMSGDTFERPQKRNKRSAARTKDRLNLSVSPQVQPKHQIPQSFHDPIGFDMPSCINFSENINRYRPVDLCFDFRDVNSQPEWSFLPNEDAKDSSSLRSEESSSSRAVRDGIDNSRSNTKARQNRNQGNAFGRSDDYHGVEDTFFNETERYSRDDDWQGTFRNQSKEFTEFSSPSKSNLSHQPSCTFQKKLPEGGLLRKEKSTLVGINSECDSFFPGLKNIQASLVSKIWNEDPVCTLPDPESSVPEEILPPDSFLYEKFTSQQPSNHTHSEDTLFLSKVGHGLQKRNIVANCTRECLPPYSSDFSEKSQFPDILSQGNICRNQETIPNHEPVPGGKLKVDMEHCFSSEKEEALDNGVFTKVGELKEKVAETPEVIESQRTRCPGDIALLMKTPNRFRNIIAKKQYISSTTSCVPCPNVDQVNVALEEKNGAEQDSSYSSHQETGG